MKKFVYLAMALGLVACQAENPGGNDGLEGEEGVTNYISVNIVSANTSTRADDYVADDGKDYVDGTEAENAVDLVRFYFFDDQNKAAKVHHSTTDGVFYDWTPNGGGSNHDDSVEKILNAVVVINIKEDQDKGVPTKIVAVLNPSTTLKAKSFATLADLNAEIGNYSRTSTDEKFLMTNSIYKENPDGAINVEGHIYPTVAAAQGDPVTIYVERVLAKVDVDITADKASATDLEITGENTDIYDTGILVDEEKVFVKFNGWNVTATAQQSHLVKRINASWSDNLLGETTAWNWSGHRSFWAINPNSMAYDYGAFNSSGNSDNVNPASAYAFGTSAYPQENAGDASDYTNTPTKVILSAELVDKKGEALTLVKYAGNLYVETEESSVLSTYANLANVYTLTSTLQPDQVTENDYDKIDKDVLEYMTASKVEGKTPGEMASSNKSRYFVYAQLTEEAKGTDYYYRDGYDEQNRPIFTKYEDDNEVNKHLRTLGSAMVWDSGQTYYYFDIRHLNNSPTTEWGNPSSPTDKDLEAAANVPGFFGIVRNHVYRSHIRSIFGLGTPVYDPEEVIIPEKPEEDNTVIAAQIEILSWRIVENGYDLNWGE